MRLSFQFSAIAFLVMDAYAAYCYMPLDIVFVQDTTGTFQSIIPTIASQLSTATTAILSENPNSRFALAHFRDKPYFPVGIDTDYCYKHESDFLGDAATFQSTYAALTTTSGGDLPDAQYHALVSVAQDASLTWRSIQRPANPEGDSAGARVVVIITDSEPHLEGDVAQLHAVYPDTLPNLPSHPEIFTGLNATQACLEYDYPSATYVGSIIATNNIYLVILTPNTTDVADSWTWINESLLGQAAGFYQRTNSDFSDFSVKLIAAMQAVTEAACGAITVETTTPASDADATTSLTNAPEAEGSASQNCSVPCPPSGPCCARPGVLIEVNNNPKKLTVDYEK